VPKKKSTKVGLANAQSLVDKLDLFAIGVDSLKANLDRSNYATAYADNKKRIARSVNTTCKVTDFSEEHFDVTATLSLRVKATRFEEPVLAIDIALSGHFHPKQTVTREEAEAFAEAEARLIFWPYLRQIVSDTTARMHIGTITLPIVVG
jgi:preprotein translocase subunit SecB